MTNNDLAVELLQQRKKKREDPQSATTQTSTQNMSGQAALAQELLSQRIQARKEREATQPTVSLPSQRIDPAKERQTSNGKFNGWKYFGNLGKTLMTGVASLAQTGAMAEDVVTSAVDTIFKGANAKGSGLFNALYHGRPDWKFLGKNGLVGIEQEKAYLDQEREAEVAKINDANIAGKVAKRAASYGGDIAYGVGYAIPMAATAGVSAAPIVNGVATSTEALASMGASVIEQSGILNTLQKGFRDTLTSRDYWTAFASEVGADYQEALSDGATTAEAMNYAVALSALNSIIEIGGGIQNVPEKWSVKAFLKNAVDEGKEEIEQGIVGRTMQNLVYGANNPIASVSDDRAIFNPATSAQEFAGGFTVGGILSGAQAAAGKAVNHVYNKQVEKQISRYEQAQARVKDLSGVKGTYQTEENGKTMVDGQESAIKSVVKDGKIELENGEVVSPDKVTFADRNTADLYEGAINRAANAGAANVFVDSYTGGDVSRYLLGMQEAYEDGRAGVVTEKRGTFADDLTDAQRMAAWNQGAADGLQTFRSDTGLGENGSDAWTQVQQNQAVKGNPRLRTGFTAMYQAGLSGKPLTDVKSDAARYIPPSVQTAAYQAGLADAASSLAREKAGVKLVTQSNESGLVDNDYSKKLANNDAGTARVLGSLASDMGVRIEIVSRVQGGAANGKYVKGTNTILLAADAENPLSFVAAHEVTHRMQDAAPTEYRAYRDAVMEYRSSELGDDTAASMVERYREASREAGVTLTQEEAMDEIAADFTAKMINDADLFGRFADKNRSAAGKLLDGLKAFISRVKTLFTGKARDKAAQEAYGKNFVDLQKVADLWQTAYDKAAETIRESTNAVTANADESAKLQIRRKYWKPQLHSDEWALLNRKLDEGIGSSKQYLDESTKWLYADEKGVQVFALYGIGDGTEATPLYAVGGKQARADAAALMAYIKEEREYDGNRKDFDTLLEGYGRSSRDGRSNLFDRKRGSAENRTAGLHRGSQGRDAGGTSGRGAQNQPGIKEKFSLRDSAGRIVEGGNGVPYWNDLSYRGYTEDSAIPNSIGYAMFADDPHAIENYGSRFAAVRHDDLPTIDDFKESIAKAWERDKAKYLLPPELEVFSDRSGAEMADHFDPVDIVDGADAWDTPELITWAFSHGIFDEVGGVKTSDGAIVWDESLIRGTSDDGGVWGGNLHAGSGRVTPVNGDVVSIPTSIALKSTPIRSTEILTDGAVVTSDDGAKYSLKSMKHDIAEGQMFEDLKTYCNWTQTQVDTLKTNIEGLIRYMEPHRGILDMNEAYGREGRRFSPYKPNSDPLYKISMDFSTLCSKRLLTQYVIENLQVREGRPMPAEEQMAVRDMLIEYRNVDKGLQVACAMCYVEAARLKSPKQIQLWLDDRTSAMRSYYASQNPEYEAKVKEAQADFKESRGYGRKTSKKNMRKADVKELDKIRPRMSAEYQLSAEEQSVVDQANKMSADTFLTAANLAQLSEDYPDIYAAYTSKVRSATRSKSLETDEPYYYGDSRRDNGNGVKVSDRFIENVNRENGMRFSSWSDWRIQHMLDYITAVIDNSVRGAKMHGYTKFPDEVRVLGKTGMMFNLSGVAGAKTGLNPDGTLNFSPTESINIDEARALRAEFPETAGMQVIGVSDAHIRALMASDDIDYIIPYHTSSLNKDLRRMADIHGWKDYTNFQNEKELKGVKNNGNEAWHKEPAFSEWFVGYDTGMTGIEAMRASSDRYLELCKERGLKPKFEAFSDDPNYWKLLIDRKMINQTTGELIEQKAVTPEFDFSVIKGIVDKYVENYDSSREERALKYVTDNWDSIPQRIKYLKATEKQKKAMAKLGNEMLAAQPKGERLQLKSQAQIESEMRDLKKERDRLKTRVKSLEREVARWKAEVKPSVPSFREDDLRKLGNRLINDFDSSTKYREIKTDMENLGKALLSNDVPDTDLHAYAEYIAEKIIQNSRVLDEGGEDLLEIQKHLKSVKLAYTDDGSIADFSAWKKAHRDIKFAKDGGLPVDDAYHELTEMFGGGYFPDSIVHPADQLTRMGEVLEDIDSIWSNPYDEYRDIAVTALGNALIEGMISDDVRQTRPTYAERKEKEIAHLKDLLNKTRAGRDERITQMRTAYAERTKAGSERRKANEIRARISKHASTLSQKLLHPTDKQHIPEQLRTPVAALLRSINTESARSYDENGRLRKGNTGTPTQRTQDAIRLREAYDSILSNDPNFVIDPALLGDDGTSGLIDQLVQLGNQRIDEMSAAQLNIIWMAIKGIETTITSYDKALASGKYMFISQWANDLRSGVSSRKRANKKAVLSLYDPRTFFNAYGDAGLDVFRALRNAEDTQNRRVAEVAKLTEKFMSREVYRQRNERHTFTTEGVKTITLTNDQIMNLYNLANRGEHSMQHLSIGGVVQPYIKRDGKLQAIERGTENIQLTANDVAQITDVLTDEQIKVAKGLQKIASTLLAKWGNEASMAVYGYNKFTEEHYWPIKSAREAIVQNAERGENMSREIRNMGSAKALNENASNTLDLGGVFDVFTKNASDMITYSTMLKPMEDINRLFNYRYRDSAGNLTGKNVKNVLTDVYGEQAPKYWQNLMRDVQNGIAHDDEPITRMIEKLVGRTKAASVGMNARVVLQQPTAFFRAAAIIDPSDMAKGLVKAPTKGNGWKKAKQYAGIAAIKDSSGFDQAGQYTIMKDILNGADQTFMDKLSDASGAAAAKADAVTWGKIWNACEYTVQREGRYEVGSEEFYTRTAEVFSDVIDQTQVVDGILQRTQIMRSGNGLTKQATAFMGEPMKSLNMLLRSYDAWRYETNPSKKSAALKQFTRTSIALLVTDGVNALVQSLVDAARKDDKDKDYWGRYFEVLTGVTGEDDTAASVLLGSNLWDNIDPVGRIPFAKDIKSMLQGYTVSRMDADAVSDFIAAAQLFTKAAQGDGQKTPLYAFKQLLATGSKIFGISVGNIGRDTWAVARSIVQETGSYWAMYQMEQMIYRVAPDAKNSSRYYSILYHALQDDKAAYDRIYADLISKGYTDKQIKTGMKNAIKNAGGSDMLSQLEDVGFSREDSETVIKQQEFKQSYGFSYDDLADEYADGNISRREVIRALQNVDGLSAEDAELKATVYDWKNAGVSDATNAIVKAYQSYGSGFDKKSFAEAYTDLNAVKGEDTDGDGKTEKKQFVLEAINKMNISTAQKDALYRMKGYGEKQLADAPWH